MPFAAVAAGSSIVTTATDVAGSLGIKTTDALRKESLAASYAALTRALAGDRSQLAYMFDRRQHGPDGTRRGYWRDRLTEYYQRTGEPRTAVIDQLIETKVDPAAKADELIAQVMGATSAVPLPPARPSEPSLLDKLTSAFSPPTTAAGTGQPSARSFVGPVLIGLGVLAIAGALIYAGRGR